MRVALVLALTVSFALPVAANEGDLDESFADQGVFQVDLDDDKNDLALTIAIGDDGAIYASGSSNPLKVIGLRSDGTPDGSFGTSGTNGVAVVHPNWPATALASTIDSNGNLILAGAGENPQTSMTVPWITRIDPSGAVDSSIGNEGQVYVGDVTGTFRSVWIDGSGRIVAVGTRGTTDVIVARLRPNGTPDPSFGTQGIVTIPDVADTSLIYGAPASGGGVFIAGTVVTGMSKATDIFVIRLDQNGHVDQGFGTVIVDILDQEETRGIAVTPTGRIVILAELGVSELALTRLLPTGELDRSLRASGHAVISDFGGSYPSDVTTDRMGRILVTGEAPAGGFVARIRANGLLDPEFGDGGVGMLSMTGSFDRIDVDPNDGVVVGGTISGMSGQDSLVARFDASIPDVSFADDDQSTFEADIERLGQHGITRGCNPPVNDRFCPDEPVTRGQMAAFLVRALGLTDDGGGDLFSDDDGSTFRADIDRLGTAGVTLGCNPPTNDQFCPDDQVTRGQMAAFLVRALGYADDGGGDLFVDDDESTFRGDIDRLGAAGVTLGCNPPTNDRFCPDDTVTRGQMAAFLTRALGLP